ncbi:MAG TPA: tyrosine-type recombinase/integrase [Thermoanaerobaculia bacterium]|nr:tyrosine-type recombinase/integrase [Thermoanaerobaculia bacterium]
MQYLDRVWLPEALDRKFPSAARDRRWQWVFPAPQRWKGKDGSEGRHHYHERNVQRSVTRAARAAGMTKRVICHTFRHSFATYLLSGSTTFGPSRSSLANRDVSTTMIYTHVLRHGARGVRSPLDPA